jgi:hypothetical protein
MEFYFYDRLYLVHWPQKCIGFIWCSSFLISVFKRAVVYKAAEERGHGYGDIFLGIGKRVCSVLVSI